MNPDISTVYIYMHKIHQKKYQNLLIYDKYFKL